MAKSKATDESEGGLKIPVLDDDAIELALRTQGLYYVWGPIEQGSLKSIHADLSLKREMGHALFAKKEIRLAINSPGGDLDEANALIDLLANVPWDVATVGYGTCASAAAMLLASGTKGRRYAAPNTLIMAHVFTWSSEGKHHDLVAHRKPEDDAYKGMLRFWQKHSKYRTARDVEKHLLRKHDVWMTAAEALEHGIIDHIGSELR